MKINKTITLSCLGIVALTSASFGASDAKAKQKAELKSILQKLNASGLLAFKIPNQDFAASGLNKLPPENFDHRDGAYRVESPLLTVWQSEPLSFYIGGLNRTKVFWKSATPVPQSEITIRSLRALRIAYPWFFKEKLPPVSIDPINSNGNRTLIWQRYNAVGEDRSQIMATARVLDGKIVQIGAVVDKRKWNYKISPLECRKRVVKYLKAKGANRVVTGLLAYSDIAGLYQYEVRYTTFNKDGRIQNSGTIVVDTKTGGIFPGFDGNDVVHGGNAGEVMPTWMGENLLFLTKKRVDNLPSWISMPSQIVFQTGAGERKMVTLNLESSPDFISLNDGFLCFFRQGYSYLVDLKRGSHRLIGSPWRPGIEPSSSPDGAFVAVSSFGPRADERDIFVSHMDVKGDVSIGKRLRIQGADETKPVFTHDGTALYFVSVKSGAEIGKVEIRKIDASEFSKKGDLINNSSTFVADLPENPQRMSISTDDKSIVVQGRNNIFIVRLDSNLNSVSKFSINENIEAAKVTDFKDATVGPGNERISFSAKVKGDRDPHHFLIYSCRFDGSDLRLESHQAAIREMYEFPISHDSALNLEKSLAIAEMRMESAHRAN